VAVTIAVAVALVLVLLVAGGLATRVGEWYRALRKPSWNPPDWAFAPAWTVILGLAGWAGVLAWTHAPDPATRLHIAAAYAVNGLLHFVWSPLFFLLKRPDWALGEAVLLWLSVAALVAVVAPLSALGGWLLAPYLAWVAFAIALNAAIVRLNAPFSRRAAA
jgi:translocator protein